MTVFMTWFKLLLLLKHLEFCAIILNKHAYFESSLAYVMCGVQWRAKCYNIFNLNTQIFTKWLNQFLCRFHVVTTILKKFSSNVLNHIYKKLNWDLIRQNLMKNKSISYFKDDWDLVGQFSNSTDLYNDLFRKKFSFNLGCNI